MTARTVTLPPPTRLSSRPELWFALAGLTLFVVGLVGLLDLNDEGDVMRRELGWLGIGGVSLLGAIALVVSLSISNRAGLMVSGAACLIATGGMTLPLAWWLHGRSSEYDLDCVNLSGESTGWCKWFVSETLVIECLVGIAVTSVLLIVGMVLSWRQRDNVPQLFWSPVPDSSEVP